MTLLQWQERYSVGIDAVDHEHKELIELINRLHDKLTANGDESSIEAFFGDLFKGVSSHFALEEKLMRERHYDQVAQHKQDHERLLDEIRDIMDEFSGEADIAELSAQLDAWFSKHFETHDARLHQALTSHSQ